MSNVVLLGTSLAPDTAQQRRRMTTDFDTRVTDDGFFRICYLAPVQINYHRVTSVGDRRITSDGFYRLVIGGQQGPLYFQVDNVSDDGGEAFGFYHETNPWQPESQGGESVFRWAYFSMSSSMGATIRISPVVDGSADDVVLPNGDAIEFVRSTFSFPQQPPPYERLTQVLAVPIVRRQLRAGVEVGRFYLRGERLQFIIESIGALGVGELLLEGVQVDVEPVRKAIYPGLVASP